MQEMNGRPFRICIVFLLLGVAIYVAKYQTTVLTAMSGQQISNQDELPIYRVDTGEDKKISVTFDAAWGTEDLDSILSILASHNCKATFFVSGDWVQDYPEAILKISAAGHELGNHGMHHKHMPEISDTDIQKEIMDCHIAVKSLTGIDMCVFRAPYSDWSKNVISVAQNNGYACINQDVDSVDWKDYGVQSIIDTVMNDPDLNGGSILLLHNGSKYTKDALDELLTQLEKAGYSYVPVSDLIYKDNYEILNDGTQKSLSPAVINN